MRKNKLPLSEILGYLRIKIGLSTSLIALLGYTMGGGRPPQMWNVLIASLLMTMGVYSFNLRTDLKEDTVNKQHINQYSKNWRGAFISFGLALFSLIVVKDFPTPSIEALAASGTIGFLYSIFRWKWVPHLKNISITTGFALMYLFGSYGAGPIQLRGLLSLLVIFLIIFGMSILADMRDYRGDFAAGIPTYPAVIGVRDSGFLVTTCFLVATIILVIGRLGVMYYILPFTVSAMIIAHTRKDYLLAHHYMRTALILVGVLSIF